MCLIGKKLKFKAFYSIREDNNEECILTEYGILLQNASIIKMALKNNISSTQSL